MGTRTDLIIWPEQLNRSRLGPNAAGFHGGPYRQGLTLTGPYEIADNAAYTMCLNAST